MKATVGNLRDEVFVKRPDHRFLYCLVCGTECSAHNDDYWNLPSDYEFKCCDRPMVLATKKTVITTL